MFINIFKGFKQLADTFFRIKNFVVLFSTFFRNLCKNLSHFFKGILGRICNLCKFSSRITYYITFFSNSRKHGSKFIDKCIYAASKYTKIIEHFNVDTRSKCSSLKVFNNCSRRFNSGIKSFIQNIIYRATKYAGYYSHKNGAYNIWSKVLSCIVDNNSITDTENIISYKKSCRKRYIK